MASPCPRGSTWSLPAHLDGQQGFPVPAGIDPRSPAPSAVRRRLPRARGDRPPAHRPVGEVQEASPCPRGSTPRMGWTAAPRCGFPVPAGIDPPRLTRNSTGARLPRARGDRPRWAVAWSSLIRASPCPRGSTLLASGHPACPVGFPVPAGIDPLRAARATLDLGLPRARGDRPDRPRRRQRGAEASPCPRGSTRIPASVIQFMPGFPVPAGIDPRRCPWHGTRPRLPRARGDRPLMISAAHWRCRASPCPRGSTLSTVAPPLVLEGFPVPAGIDLSDDPFRSSTRRLPRARGDRPAVQPGGQEVFLASPCPRGSTLLRQIDPAASWGFPVPAGIDPNQPRPSAE